MLAIVQFLVALAGRALFCVHPVLLWKIVEAPAVPAEEMAMALE
jgi:hypothetical protein